MTRGEAPGFFAIPRCTPNRQQKAPGGFSENKEAVLTRATGPVFLAKKGSALVVIWRFEVEAAAPTPLAGHRFLGVHKHTEAPREHPRSILFRLWNKTMALEKYVPLRGTLWLYFLFPGATTTPEKSLKLTNPHLGYE